jgi:hypothetical protein
MDWFQLVQHVKKTSSVDTLQATIPVMDNAAALDWLTDFPPIVPPRALTTSQQSLKRGDLSKDDMKRLVQQHIQAPSIEEYKQFIFRK